MEPNLQQRTWVKSYSERLVYEIIIVADLSKKFFYQRIRPSPYKIEFGKDETCKKLCTKSYKAADDKIKFLKHGMMFSYEQHWIVDNMPITESHSIYNISHHTYVT